MADETGPAIGMSVGATTLAAVTAERAVTRRPVLTLYPNRSPQVGTPAENPDIAGPGLAISDFVDQVGAPVPVVASDGSTHRGEQLLADGLRALAYSATEGRPLPPAVVVAHPAHWSPTAVDALQVSLARVPEWSQHPVLLVSDVVAALTALQANPGLPADGIIAVCDFGGSGTSFTLVDAARGHQPIDATLRHTGFSGDLIDQALLDHMLAELSADGSLTGTSAIGSLVRLRDQCRSAKEQLSTNTVTELHVDLPGFHGGIWLTRAELDEAIREPFDGFLAAVQKMSDRNNIQVADLTAVVAVGGGANIPAITTGLSQRLGVVVTSSPRPQLTPAIGAALSVAGGSTGPEVVAPPSVAMTPVAPKSPPPPVETALPPTPIPTDMPPFQPAMMPPPETIESQAFTGQAVNEGVVWYRRPILMILGAGAALTVLVAGIIAVITLRHPADSEPTPSSVTSESVVSPTPTELPTGEESTPPAEPTFPSSTESVPPASESPENPETTESPEITQSSESPETPPSP